MKYLVVPRSYVFSTTVLIAIVIPGVLMDGLQGSPWSFRRVVAGLGSLGLGWLCFDGLRYLGWCGKQPTIVVTVERQEARTDVA